MQEKMTQCIQQISSGQLSLLLAVYLFGGLQIFSPVEQVMPHNQWLTTLGAGVIGFFLVLLYLSIPRLFPEMNFAQVLTAAFGGSGGSILRILYVLQFLLITAFSLLLTTSFWVDLDVWYTPQIFIMLLVLAAAAFGAYLGIEVIARGAVIVMSLLLVVAALDTVFIIPEMRFDYLLPLQEIDMAAWVKSMKYVLLLRYFNLLMMIIPATQTKGRKRWSKAMRGWLALSFLYVVFIDLRSALVLGPSAYLYDYPSVHVLKVINLVEVLPQVELIGIMIIIAVGILRMACLFSVCLEMVNDTFCLRARNAIILPLALLVLSFAFFFVGFSEGISRQLDAYFLWVGVPLYLVVPVLLVLIGRYQAHKRKEVLPLLLPSRGEERL